MKSTSKLISTFFCLFLVGSSFAQVGEVQISSGNPYFKHYLSFFNDTLAKIIIDDFENQEYIVGKYRMTEDSLIFSEIGDEIFIRNEVFFRNYEDLAADRIDVLFFQSVHDTKGSWTYDTLKYVVNGVEYEYNEQQLMGYQIADYHQMTISRPSTEDVKIEVYTNDNVLLDTFEFQLKPESNVVELKMLVLQTNCLSSTEEVQIGISQKVVIQGREKVFICNLFTDDERLDYMFE